MDSALATIESFVEGAPPGEVLLAHVQPRRPLISRAWESSTYRDRSEKKKNL